VDEEVFSRVGAGEVCAMAELRLDGVELGGC
jgi:hypothetical protein